MSDPRKFKNDIIVQGDIALPSETANRALIIDGAGEIASSAVTSTELGYVSGVTSAIQTQLDAKASTAYVDSRLEGLKPKTAVRAATLVAGTLATSFENGDVIDGVTLATGDRILIKDQASAIENGIYVVQATGAPVRSTDFDSTSPVDEINGAYTFVQEGSQAGQGWVQTGTVVTVGVSDIDFVYFNSVAGLVGGDGISITGNTIAVDHDGEGLTFVTNQLALELDGATLSKSASGLKLSDTAVTPGSFGTATQVSTITVDQQGRLTSASNTAIAIPASQVTDFNEAAQDAVGTILVDTSTVNLTYTDGTPSITADVITQLSITSDASGVKLVNDAATPGNSYYYGTNASGTKGYFAITASGSPGDIAQTSFSAANNQASPADVTGFAFANASVRSFSALVSVAIDATADLFEEFHLQGIQRGADWNMSVDSVGDESGIVFSITASGQIQYTSTNVAGFVSNDIRFRAIVTNL